MPRVDGRLLLGAALLAAEQQDTWRSSLASENSLFVERANGCRRAMRYEPVNHTRSNWTPSAGAVYRAPLLPADDKVLEAGPAARRLAHNSSLIQSDYV